MGLYKRALRQKNGKIRWYYYCRWSVNGKEKKKSLGPCDLIKKSVALVMWEEIRREVKLGKLGITEVTVPTLSEFSTEYLAHVRDVKRNRTWRHDSGTLVQLCKTFGNRKLTQIKVSDILDYQSSRLKQISRLRAVYHPATVNRELTCLKALINFAKQRQKFFGDNPVSQVKFLPEDNQMERILTDEEEERLMEVSPPYLKNIIQTALHTGMRRNEIVNLKWDNIDFDNSCIYIERGFVKTKKAKRVPINSELRGILLEQKLYSGHHEYVFLHSKRNRYKNAAALYNIYKAVCRRAGLGDLRFHDLRHTAATRMIEEGVRIEEVAVILGHHNINMTRRYYHPEESLREAVEKLAKRHKRPAKNTTSAKSE